MRRMTSVLVLALGSAVVGCDSGATSTPSDTPAPAATPPSAAPAPGAAAPGKQAPGPDYKAGVPKRRGDL